MKHIAIIYQSKSGQTEKITKYMELSLLSHGYGVQRHDVNALGSDFAFDPQVDAVIVGCPVYAQQFSKTMLAWVRSQSGKLSDLTSAFFTVSLNAADKRTDRRLADDGLLRQFIQQTHWTPDYVASIAGAIQYTQYSWPLRKLMLWISQSAGGPTDTRQDHEMTDWNTVDAFLEDFCAENNIGPFASVVRLPDQVRLQGFMPQFEQAWTGRLIVAGQPSDIYRALAGLNFNQMKMARFLAAVRTLGRGEKIQAQESFAQTAKRFGMVTLYENMPYEFVTGLIGRFWRFNFGIETCRPDEFSSFAALGFSKVVTVIRIEAIPGMQQSLLHAEMRIHSTSPGAQRLFRWYWRLLGVGIRLYMGSLLRAIQRQAESGSPAAQIERKGLLAGRGL
ncbi:MAG: flavodoxin domain-containing protein [Bdellovibrionales bacterium]